MKILNEDGNEIEVYTAEDMKAKEDEFGKTLTQKETELAEARTALNERTGEFKQFRKLNDEAVAKLSVAERTIYENGLALQKVNEERADSEKKTREGLIDTAIHAKAGTDEKLFLKMKDMYSIMGIEATTPAEIERKTLAVLGAIGATEPDLIASVNGFSGGSYTPPRVNNSDDKSFADTDRGRAIANELGLKLEATK